MTSAAIGIRLDAVIGGATLITRFGAFEPCTPACEPTAARTMSGSSLRQLLLPLEPVCEHSRDWAEVLAAAFADRHRKTGFLPLAEDALRAHPGDAVILCYAATAALLDETPARALVFLKRYAKRYVPGSTWHLLYALALAQENKIGASRALLERHALTYPHEAVRVFPGGQERSGWLVGQLRNIVNREGPDETPARFQTKPAVGSVLTGTRENGRRRVPLPQAQTAAAAQVVPRPAAERTRGLPRGDVEIPFTAELDLAPLITASAGAPEGNGEWYRLRERFARLGLAQGFDELLCTPHLRGIETFWYQVETVRKVLKQFRGRVLLADEVGLGKTIEAGMVLKEYLLRGMVETVLVLAPAALVGQWREELETKFDVSCATSHDPLLRTDPEAFWSQRRLIASLALARRSEHASRLLNRSFDLVIIDEAHHLRERTSQGYKLVDALNKRFLLLLSATPVQNDLTELYNLLTLLKPGIFKTLKEFRSAYVTPGKPRQPANPERLRELMRGAMIRNTRAVVAIKLPRRHATIVRVEGSEAERQAYLDLACESRRLAAEDAPGRHRLSLHHLLGTAGSSPAAAAVAMQRFAARHPGGPWQTLAQGFAAIGTSAKEAALLDLLRRNPAEKKLVFVHYRETLDHLARTLMRQGVIFARFEGSLGGREKDAAIAAFRDSAPVLLCTQSGGEGRNIQFCNTLINFDVPWNPMAIEQRIGRIDRIGQEREVFVFNLVARGTLEEQVLRLLDEKISMFELVVGEVGAILGGIEEDRDFAELVLDAWLATTEAGRAEAFEAIGQRLTMARRQHESAKSLDEALFGQDFEAA
jgi:superfamily II DNA or RNA helicase